MRRTTRGLLWVAYDVRSVELRSGLASLSERRECNLVDDERRRGEESSVFGQRSVRRASTTRPSSPSVCMHPPLNPTPALHRSLAAAQPRVPHLVEQPSLAVTALDPLEKLTVRLSKPCERV